MSLGLIGKKIGMTREFFDIGILTPVTILKVEKGRIMCWDDIKILETKQKSRAVKKRAPNPSIYLPESVENFIFVPYIFIFFENILIKCSTTSTSELCV